MLPASSSRTKRARTLGAASGAKLLRSSALCFALLSLETTREALADCQPNSGISPCIDANALWPATGSARFIAIPSPRALDGGRVGLAVAAQALFRPLNVLVPSPDPSGREVRLVDRVFETDLLLAVGLGKDLELGVALPIVLRQTGAGAQGLSAQAGAPIDAAGERDPRVSLSRVLSLGSEFGVKPRLEVGVPLGNDLAFASAGAFTLAPALPLEFRTWHLTAGAELGLRLRRPVSLANLRWGSEGELALGVSFAVLPNERLSVSAEAFVLPSLIDAASARAQALAIHESITPSEYLVSLRSQPLAQQPWSLALGAGGGIPLSSESSSLGTDHFLAPTSPALRVFAEIRYAPAPER